VSARLALAAAAGAAALLVAGAPRHASSASSASPIASAAANGWPATGLPEIGAPGSLVPPLPGAVLTQPFGCTPLTFEPADPACPSGHVHTGLDLAAPAGSPVRAAAAGRARVLWSPAGYGLYLLIDNGGGVQTLYGHLSAASVADGAEVGAGQEVGLVGSTGLSTGPHLHFEVRRGGRPVDPTPFLPAGH
jgi:murein DD-endopeptidase MepM/ murein hydrolase activator NlpD